MTSAAGHTPLLRHPAFAPAYGHTWSVKLNGKGVIPRVVE